jgi:ABC-2 type transport system ATP-binding protein
MATPYLDEAERCTRVALLHEGRLLAIDEPAALQARLSGQMLEVIADAPRPPLEVLARAAGAVDVQSFGDRAHVRVHAADAPQAIAAVTAVLRDAGIEPVSIRPVAASLEDVFIDLITDGRQGAGSTRAGN